LTQEFKTPMITRAKYIFLLSILVLLFTVSCTVPTDKKPVNAAVASTVISFASNNYGAEITKTNAKEMRELPSLFTSDTVQVKMTGTVKEVCQHTGCWLTVAYGTSEIMVNMKDEFAVPKDISGKTVWIDGIAFRELVSVETLKKLAAENRSSQAEIDSITQPVYDYTILASGVIIE